MAGLPAIPAHEEVPPPRLGLDPEASPFNGQLSLGIWNARGLFCIDAVLQGDKTRHALDLARRADIMGFVETHDDGYRGRSITTEIGDSHLGA